MGKVYKVFKTVVRTLLIVIVGILLVYNAYILIARTLFKNGMPEAFGFACATVVSGSMRDEIDVGDFIITKSQKEYAVGDVITFSTMKAAPISRTALSLFPEIRMPQKGTQTIRQTISVFPSRLW